MAKKQRKQRAPNKKVGKAQQRILDKYASHIANRSPYDMWDRSPVARQYRKMVNARSKVIRQMSLLYEGPKFFDMKPLEIRKTRDKMYDLQNQFLVEKERFYQVKDYQKGLELGFTQEKFDELSDDDLTKVEQFVNKLENYQKGDHTRTEFYHKHGFNFISNYNVWMFLRLEGLI